MRTHEPDRHTEEQDQQQFDNQVARSSRTVLQLLGGVAVLAALVMSTVALSQSGQQNAVAAQAQPMVMPAAAVASTAPAAPAAVKTIDLKIIPISKMGPDHKKHDAFTQTDFAVKVGQPVTLRINNTDNGEHSITSPTLGVNIVIKPGIHTYTLVVAKAGKFQWYCMVPCDSDAHGWAMQNPGFMSGYITAS
jgi:ABC-type transport system involved in cytochrome bd biosynthesis fused ATPase/permease subunit